MRHIHKQSLFIAMSIGMVLMSCKKSFLDVNTDPNRVTDNNITPELLFPAAAEATGSTIVGARAVDAGAKTNMQFLQSWIGYMAANGDFARDPTETSYNIDFTFNNTLWNKRYDALFDLHQTEVKALAGADTVLAGAAIILSAKMWQELVDLFGNIPYSQAFHVSTTTRPAYDKAQDIYNALQLRLDTAIRYMGLTASKKFTAAVDIVNKGNQTKWIKFANTLKLRLLIRQSEVSGFNPSAEIAKIFPAGVVGVLGAGESVSVNPGYSNDVNKQNPFYANYGYTPTGVIAAPSENANAYILNILLSNNDPRAARFFTPVGSSFVGDVYGDDPGNIPAGNKSSYFGPGIVSSPTQDQWLMPSYESLFFLAEAVARGWVPGNAQTAYQNAVTESFVWLSPADTTAQTQANAYMSSNASANWANAGTTPLAKAKFIAFQKYIANTCIDPQESYSDQRRLNFLPASVNGVSYISKNPSKAANTLPLRVLYAQSEYTTNSVNVLKEGTINPFTTKLFWEP